MNCTYLISYFISLTVSISLCIGYILLTTPRADAIKRTPFDSEIQRYAKAVETLFTTDHIEESTTTGVIANFTHYLNNETTRPYAMKLMRKMNIFNLILDRVDMVSPRCKEIAFKRYIFYFISFARELILHGKSSIFSCRMPTLIRTMEECKDPQVDKLCMYLMVTAIAFEKGGLCFQGAAQAFASIAARYPFGTIDWEVLSIMSIWADRVDSIAEPDRIGMCNHIARLIENRAFWTTDVKTHFAWMHQNIKCHEFDKIDIEEIKKDSEVREFLRQTKELDSDL